MNAFFIVDHHTDVAEVSEVRKMVAIVMDSLQNPHTVRPAGEWPGGESHRQSVAAGYCGLLCLLSF